MDDIAIVDIHTSEILLTLLSFMVVPYFRLLVWLLSDLEVENRLAVPDSIAY